MLKLIPVKKSSPFIFDICQLLNEFYGVIFYFQQNPITSFLNDLYNNKIVVIAAFKDSKFIAFLVLHNFQKVSKENFCCYIYGAAKRGHSVDLDNSLNYIFSDLKEKGCVVVRCEVKECNMPMRQMANRLKFQKIAILKNTYFQGGNFRNSFLYEKVL